MNFAMPDSLWQEMILGSGLANGDRDKYLIELYIPKEHPENGKVISETTVDRVTGQVLKVIVHKDTLRQQILEFTNNSAAPFSEPDPLSE